jgi:hypothetical protein
MGRDPYRHRTGAAVIAAVLSVSGLGGCNDGPRQTWPATGGDVQTGGAGGSGSNTTLPPSSPVPPEQLPDAYLTAICEAALGCAPEGYRDVAECKRDRIAPAADDMLAGIAEGRIAYDAEAIGLCLALIQATVCRVDGLSSLNADTLPTFVDACLGDQGLGTEGAECRSDVECADGHTCLGATCPGTCRALGEPGADCSSGLGCEEPPEIGLIERLSAPLAADIEEDRLKDFVVRCLGPSPLTCHGPAELGESCVQYQPCAGGFCNEQGICEPLATEEGDECGKVPNDLLSFRCVGGLRCLTSANGAGVSARCFRPLLAGEICPGAGFCAKGLTCLPAADVSQQIYPEGGRCGLPSGLGGPCHKTAVGNCTHPLGCSPEGVCRELPGEGEGCLTGRRCGPGLVCNTRCERAIVPGEPCSSSCVGICRDGMCEARRLLGETCVLDDDCTSRHCQASICTDTAACASRGP